MLIARLAFQMKKPILAMCAGQNALVRALDGSTMQLSDQEAKKHNNEKVHKVHGAYAVSGTDYEKIVGSGTFAVNSIHSYVIKNPGPYLNVLGHDDEGHIEVVGNNDLNNHFVVASRFHPETIFKMIQLVRANGGSEQEVNDIISDNRTSYRMFDEFAKACEKNKNLNSSTDLNDSEFIGIVYPDSLMSSVKTDGRII